MPLILTHSFISRINSGEEKNLVWKPLEEVWAREGTSFESGRTCTLQRKTHEILGDPELVTDPKNLITSQFGELVYRRDSAMNTE